MYELDNSLESYDLTFYKSPISLQDIASVHAALQLWRTRIRNRSVGEKPTTKWFQTQHFTIKDVITAKDTVRLTSCAYAIEELIDHKIRSVGKELKYWMEYHCDRIFFDCEPHSVIWKSFDKLVFQYDGNLDYITTAKQLLNSNRLSQTEKYRLACIYCMEEKIRQMWPTFFINNYSGVYNATIKPIITYWGELMLRELRGKFKPNDKSAIKRMISTLYKYPRNWIAVEYFFKKLQTDEQTSHMIDLVEFSILYAIHLLPQLNNDQILTVMMKKGIVLWFRFSKDHRYVDYAIRTWYYIRSFTSEYSFFSMIKLTIDEQLIKVHSKGYNNKFAIGLLYEIWISAPEQLKNYVLSNYIPSIVELIFEPNYEMQKIMKQDCRFLLATLSDTSFQFRYSLWQKYSTQIVISVPPVYLKQLLELCIQDEEQITKLRETIRLHSVTYETIKNHCIDWIQDGSFEYFDKFSKVLCLDKESAVKLKQDTLIRGDHLGHYIFQLFNKDKWHKFRNFVDVSFDDHDLAISYKKCFVYSTPLYDDLLAALSNGRLSDVTYFLDLFVSNEELNELKRNIFEDCRNSLSEGKFYNFTATSWQHFFKWCLNTEHNVTEFKCSVPISDIFETSVEKNVRFVSNHDTFENELSKLNNFLVWYFGSIELSKEFKMNKIRVYNGIKSIKMKFQTENDRVIDTLVDWHFEGNKHQIIRWSNPSSTNIPPCMMHVMGILKQKWFYCGEM